MRPLSSLILMVLLAACPAAAAEYHVDATAGDDDAGDGTEAAPFRSLQRVRPLLAGGDTVVLYDGNYGAVEEVQAGPANLFDDWVTYRAAEGAAPEIESVLFGRNGGACIGPDQRGAYDVYLRFEGLRITDGLLSYGARHWALVDCLVERYGPWTGSAENIEKTAVAWRGGTDILIQDCEITRTGTAVAGRGHDVRILGNHIHGGTHDGIRVTGFWNSLIEGNLIHDFDDGVTDGEADWSRHCDLIHIFIPGPGYDGWQNHNVVFRGNVLYDAEAQIVQFNNYGAARNELILFENNVFGPGHAPMFNNADPCDGLVFRNNTVVHIPGGRQYNRWLCNNFTLRISDESTGVQVYNNILGSTGIETGAEVDVFDWNLIQLPGYPKGVDDSRAYGRFTLIGADAALLDAENMDYRVAADSPAVDAGTRHFAPQPVFGWDYEGAPRDNRPDLGAYEIPGGDPPPEEPLPEFPGPKRLFVDDFEDGHYKDVDPWLEGPEQQGLSWSQPDRPAKFYVTNTELLDRNALHEPVGVAGERRVCWIASDQGADWRDYTLEFDAYNSYLAAGGGPVVLYVDEANCYWIDIARDTGRLIRYMVDADGRPTETVLASSPAIELPHYGARGYRIAVGHDAAAVTIAVDADADGTVELAFADADPQAAATFAAGRVGFHGDVLDQYHRIKYDNVAVTVDESAAPEEPLRILRWELLENHGTAGRIAVELADGYVASTLDGVRELAATFTEPLDPATLGAGAVGVIGQLGGLLSRLVSSISLSADRTVMTIRFDAGLPDEDRYVVTVAATVAGASGHALGGNRDRILAVLAGDVNASGAVSFGDVLALRNRMGRPLTPPTARYDVDAGGTLTGSDMLSVRCLEGRQLP